MRPKHFLAAIDIQPLHEDILLRGFELARNSARESIETAIRSRHPASTEWNLVVEAGSPAARIVATADTLGADLVIVGANQRPSLRDRFLGSTADRVVRTASQPVLVVKRPPRQPYRHVLVATDFSQASATATAHAIDLFPEARLQLVHVVHVPMQFEQALIDAGSGTSIADYRRALMKTARSQLEEAAGRVVARGIRPRTRVVEGQPASKLTRLAANRDVDLIVVGTRGHGIAQRTLLGSVAHHLLRSAACDVLVASAVTAAETSPSYV
jgi:nucleotide-binding universal stress UspA family protein